MAENDLKTRFQFFSIFSAVVVGVGLTLFFVFPNVYVRAAIAIVSIVLVWLGFKLATFSGTTDNRVRLAVITGSTALLFAVLQLQRSLDWLYTPLLAEALTKLNLKVPVDLLDGDKSVDVLSAVIILSWLVVVFFVLRSLGLRSAMGVPQSSLHDLLPDVTNPERIQTLKRTLRDKLDQLDYATRWNESNYVSLEAEVQILEGKTPRRKIVDLQRALRLNPKTRLFVVLGEPGTGKSIALRKLARDLLNESSVSDRVPIYINLKEWKTPANWTIQNKPTVQQFHDFVYNNVLQNLDFSSQAFLTPENYRVLLEGGYFFFVLDSFDEIPAVLDHDENSWIIGELSSCIATYVLSGNNSRGIISSRLFRQPKLALRDRSVFEIQPFSDDRIIRAISLASSNPDLLIKIVLTERSDLGSIARNPFLLHLIINHFNQTGTVPQSQAEMFQTFIDLNLRLARDAYGLDGVTEADVYSICEDVAAAMFDRSKSGLEIGEPELRNEIDLPQLPRVLQFLTQARMGRVAPVSGAFSFSHRRFNEYFLVRRLRSKRTAIPFDAIQNDSRWRDALVLYAEIADKPDADALFAHGWRFASRLENISLGLNRVEFVQARHALRFVIEGFRNRPELVQAYQSNLFRIIEQKLASDSDYIEKKTVLEAIALLPPAAASKIIITGLAKYPGWISEEAAAAARYLKGISRTLSNKLYIHCVNRPRLTAFVEARRQIQILSISDSFKSVTRLLRWYLFDAYKTLASFVALIAAILFSRNEFWMRTMQIVGIGTIGIPIMMPIGMALKGSIRDRWSALDKAMTKLRLRFIPPELIEDYLALPKFFAIQVLFFCLILILLDIAGVERPPESGMRISDVPWPSSAVILLLAAIVAIPLRPLFWRALITRLFRVSMPAFWAALGLIALLAGFLFLLASLPPFILRVVAWTMGSIGGCFVAVLLTALCIDYFIDRRSLRSFKSNFSPDRAAIAQNFSILRTPWGRIEYVQWLEEISREHLDALRRDNNVWPEGRRPQYDGDEGSIRLAQLDARWLDLD